MKKEKIIDMEVVGSASCGIKRIQKIFAGKWKNTLSQKQVINLFLFWSRSIRGVWKIYKYFSDSKR